MRIRISPRRASWVMLLTGLVGNLAMAAPMGFKDSTMVMLEVSKNDRETEVNHALTVQDAIGIATQDMRVHIEHHGRSYHSWQKVRQLTYTRRLHRWNLPEAQANVWLFAAAGEINRRESAGDVTQTLVTPGFQVDYETTRVYSALSGRFKHANGFRQNTWTARGGFSIYETNYDEVQPWLILEAKRTSEVTQGVDWTPMLRFIHKRYFLELGVGESGDARFSLMLNF